jgi:hypothetical protein
MLVIMSYTTVTCVYYCTISTIALATGVQHTVMHTVLANHVVVGSANSAIGSVMGK